MQTLMRPVRMCMSKRDSGPLQVRGNEKLPLLLRPASALGQSSPRRGTQPANGRIRIEPATYDGRTLARRAASTNSVLCAGSTMVKYEVPGCRKRSRVVEIEGWSRRLRSGVSSESCDPGKVPRCTAPSIW